MQTRTLYNRETVLRVKSPQGENVYYMNGGPEGLVQIIDFNMVNISTLLECISWESEKPTDETKKLEPHIKPVFDKTGFCY